jgi:hypothetical protein
MSLDLQEDVLRVTKMALTWHPDLDEDFCTYLIEELDRMHGGPWQCVAGNNVVAGHYELGYYIVFEIVRNNSSERIFIFRTRNMQYDP